MSKAIKRLYHDLNHLEPNIIFPQDFRFVMSKEFAEELKLELKKVLQPQLSNDVEETLKRMYEALLGNEDGGQDHYCMYTVSSIPIEKDYNEVLQHIQAQANEIKRLQALIRDLEEK